MPVPFLLLEVLENLSTDELNKFKWFLGLKILKGCDPILTSYLESPHRQDTVSKMMQSYGEENAVNMTVAILRQIKLNNAAEDLHKSHTEETAAKGKVPRTPVSSPAICADGAAGASAPKPPIAPNSSGHFGDIINNGTGGNTGDLDKGDFGTFKGFLSQENLDGVKPIAVSKLEDASRIETVSQMTRNYGGEMAVKVAVKILKEMSNMKAAEKLTKKYAEMNGAVPSSSSSAASPPAASPPAASPPAASPPAANTMSAQDGSVIVAPTVSGSLHTLNLTINK
ncbi:hypothetical protein KUCAC02_016089 [Chaenocephalus aceratus]|uniref:Uncharacterized protein n=1 Tax=Chaenocephalus aceratus TaxID=36190 RepID=A0ACB9Y0B7_CHAAC|nr:hypothetical protein KUCAC02_016089 [Chaenocephalus aceratus]